MAVLGFALFAAIASSAGAPATSTPSVPDRWAACGGRCIPGSDAATLDVVGPVKQVKTTIKIAGGKKVLGWLSATLRRNGVLALSASDLGQQKTTILVEFDRRSGLIKQRLESTGGNDEIVAPFEFDPEGRPKRQVMTVGPATMLLLTERDSKGRLVKKRTDLLVNLQSAGNIVDLFTYDQHGQVTSQAHLVTNKKGVTTRSDTRWKHSYKGDEHRSVKSCSSCNDNGLIRVEKRGAAGELLEETESLNGKQTKAQRFEGHKFDAQGNWIERQRPGEGRPIVERREISYYAAGDPDEDPYAVAMAKQPPPPKRPGRTKYSARSTKPSPAQLKKDVAALGFPESRDLVGYACSQCGYDKDVCWIATELARVGPTEYRTGVFEKNIVWENYLYAVHTAGVDRREQPGACNAKPKQFCELARGSAMLWFGPGFDPRREGVPGFESTCGPVRPR